MGTSSQCRILYRKASLSATREGLTWRLTD
jgi:hypothetical protein